MNHFFRLYSSPLRQKPLQGNTLFSRGARRSNQSKKILLRLIRGFMKSNTNIEKDTESSTVLIW